ncbi:hypothetical protein [Bradyrhizobium sp. 604_D8_N2_3]|uniref:hypothetical protein n=1 Tax=Bradyrhizobium sp. 604_D8_N2_3 TaxID=3240370 RepID=UPI003F25868B
MQKFWALHQPSREQGHSRCRGKDQEFKERRFEIIPTAPKLAHLMQSIHDMVGRFGIIKSSSLFAFVPHS